MEQDAYEIFTWAHRVYIKGIRAGLASVCDQPTALTGGNAALSPQ